MKSVLAICVVAALLVASTASAAAKKVTGCSVNTTAGELATLQYFSGNTTVGNAHYAVNFCEVQNFTGCSIQGYVAEYDSNGACTKVYNNRVSATYENKSFALEFTYSADHSFDVAAADSLTVDVKCVPGVDSMDGRMKNGVLVYSSETVCGGYNPNPTTEAPEVPTTQTPTTAEPTTAVPATPTPEGNFTVHGCNMTHNGETADLKYFTGNATVDGNQTVGLSPCGKKTFAKCGNKQGYLATYKSNGACDRVYDVKKPSTFDSVLVQFSTEYVSTYQSIWDIARAEDDSDSIFLIVRCKNGDDQMNGVRQGNQLIFESETVCYGYNPNDTPAPGPQEESKGLSTGVIVGIVIACIAVLIVIAVIVRIKTGGDDKEGDYERV